MNGGTPSLVPLGRSWGFALAGGIDRLEEHEPTLALERFGPGFSDTFMHLSWFYRMGHRTHLVTSVTGIRTQDEALAAAMDDAELAAVTVGIYFRF